MTDDSNSIKIAKAIAMVDLFGKNISLFSSKEILINTLDKEKVDIANTLAALENKKIIKAPIESIRVYERQPYSKSVGDTLIDMDGIEIEYLIPKEGLEIHHRPSSNWITYDWYNQDDVFSDREELIRIIKPKQR